MIERCVTGFRPFCSYAAKPTRIAPRGGLVPNRACRCSEPESGHECGESSTAPTGSRRHLLQSAAGGLLLALAPQLPAQAAAGQLTLEDVTPSVAAAGPLTAREVSVISIFEAATPAVVTVFDTTLVVS